MFFDRQICFWNRDFNKDVQKIEDNKFPSLVPAKIYFNFFKRKIVIAIVLNLQRRGKRRGWTENGSQIKSKEDMKYLQCNVRH